MYVYIQTERESEYGTGLWTVGHYAPNGGFIPESDHKRPQDAAERVRWLNGGNIEPNYTITRLGPSDLLED